MAYPPPEVSGFTDFSIIMYKSSISPPQSGKSLFKTHLLRSYLYLTSNKNSVDVYFPLFIIYTFLKYSN